MNFIIRTNFFIELFNLLRDSYRGSYDNDIPEVIEMRKNIFKKSSDKENLRNDRRKVAKDIRIAFEKIK